MGWKAAPPVLYISNLRVFGVDGVLSTIEQEYPRIGLEVENIGIPMLYRTVLFIGEDALF